MFQVLIKDLWGTMKKLRKSVVRKTVNKADIYPLSFSSLYKAL